MCGIVGYWAHSGEPAAFPDALREAVRELKHRGPDDLGIWRDGRGVGLGHTRLAILDLSQTGAQPMVSKDAEIVIVFNGEIYNFRELARDLVARGHEIHGESDTEVVLAAYREWGSSCVDHFIGMFAFAIWDEPQRCLRLFRDRVGVKPLYFMWDGRILCFASELKALRRLPHWSSDIDRTAVGEFLQYGCIAAPRTIYRQVRKLLPGHWLHMEVGGPPKIAPYWSLSKVLKRGELRGSSAQLEDELEELLIDAFRYRLVADVPVGLFLSGGIDSSLLAALLHKSGVELETFTIGFHSAEHDESEAATQIANSLGFRHHLTKITMVEATGILSRWPDHFDEPFGDSSGIPTYLVAKTARERVKVVLSADGGDELFCGYDHYKTLESRMASYGQIPGMLRKAGSKALSAVVAGSPMNLTNDFAPGLHRWLRHGLAYDRLHKMHDFLAAQNAMAAARTFRTIWRTGEVECLLEMPYRDPRQTERDGEWPGHPIEQWSAIDLHEYLPDDILTKVDRATMAVGLEGREPLLDHRLVEFAFRLPFNMRHGSLGTKHILRSILYRHIPRELVDRPKKGFSVPMDKWMEGWLVSGAIRDSIDTLGEKMPFLNSKLLEGQLHAFAGSPQGRSRLWLLYVLGRWAERWM
jgi:asparagine synthase (glutamine-hydrolysing)